MTEYTESQLERLVQSEERRTAALESLVAQLPALIEGLASRRSYGGKKPDGPDLGHYRVLPKLDGIEPGSTFHMVATTYSYQQEKGRIYLYSPFPDPGDPSRCAYITSIKQGDEKLNGWVPSTNSGKLPARDVHLQVAKGKEDGKPYVFARSIRKLEIDPESITWVD